MKSQSFHTVKKFAVRFCANRRGRLRRMLLAALISGGSLVAATSSAVAAEGPPVHLGGISILVHEFIPESTAADTAADADESLALATPIHRTSSQFNQSIAAAVGASAARIGIPVEQFLEPFAMVGHLGEPAPESSPFPPRPMESAPLATTSLETSPAADLETELIVEAPSTQQQIDDIAALNCWWLGDDAVNWMTEVADARDILGTTDFDSSDDVVTEVATCVGSAPVIATIPEAYYPYDFAKRDLELDYLSLTTVQPIRPKNYVSLPQQIDIDDTNAVVATESTIEISPDCLLDELIHDATELVNRNHLHDLTLATIGESIGDWFASSADSSIRRENIAALRSDERDDLATLPDNGSAENEPEQVSAEWQLVTQSGDGEAEPTATENEIVVEAAAELVVVDVAEAPAVEEIVVAEIVTMEIADEQPLPVVADESTLVAAAEPVVVDDSKALVVEEVTVGEMVTMKIADEQPLPVVADESTLVAAAEPVIVDDSNALVVEEVTVDEMVTMEIADEQPLPVVADESTLVAATEPVEVDDSKTLAVEEVTAGEMVTMKIADEQPLPVVADESTLVAAAEPVVVDDSQALAVEEALVAEEAVAVEEAVAPEQIVMDETEVPASVEIAVADIVAIDVDNDVMTAPAVEEAAIVDVVEQLVSNDVAAPEYSATGAQEMILLAPIEELSLAQVIDAVNQWQKRVVAMLMTPTDATKSPAAEVAEKADSSNENVLR